MPSFSLCWGCQHACADCVKPVEGWDADYAPQRSCTGEYTVPSWFVRDCPKFLADRRQEVRNIGSLRPSRPVVGICVETGVRRTWTSIRKAEKEGGFKPQNIRACCNGEQESHKGWKFSWVVKG